MSQQEAVQCSEMVFQDLRREHWAPCGVVPGLDSPETRLGYFSDDGFGIVTCLDSVVAAGFGILDDVTPTPQLLRSMDEVNRAGLAGFVCLVPYGEKWSLVWSVKFALDYFDANGLRFALGNSLYTCNDLRRSFASHFQEYVGAPYWPAPTREWTDGLNLLSQLLKLA